MKIKLALFSAMIVFGCATGSVDSVSRASLLGTWSCGPTTMLGEGFELVTTGTSTYHPDGSFEDITNSTIRLTSGKVVRTRSQTTGKWTLTGRIIESRFDTSEFLWSDDPTYTVAMGQEDLDTQVKKKNWAKSKILELGDRLVSTPVESMYKGAEVVSTCVRPNNSFKPKPLRGSA